ncbi:DUF2169 family type VI secretion system accessory protein [Polyangium spumosum]|uniref:DUF2169 domain-containing protein n=1 Tax=Polyangium spumosum TaxID=889282 RepID=A0A6N7PY12_9BACT|nr:DUF2169 domain-containing protein [Polyangium spumosum]MRG94934.1 DUF2169 domain-containing protein [Polyangium spumosum]
MDVRPLCPLPATSVLFRPREKRWALAVVCKATYQLLPGTLALAMNQEPLYEQDRCSGQGGFTSVDRPADLVPLKPRVDVVLVGSAYAPKGPLLRSIPVRLVVGELEKALEVSPPRTLDAGGVTREAAPLASAPLRQILPAGLGPIAATWPARRDRLGARAAAFRDGAWHNETLGDDFDLAYFQVAPPDQQLESLRADARIVLENLLPDTPRCVTRLPGLAPRAFLSAPGREGMPLALRPDTLLIDTNRGICTVTYRGRLDLSRPTDRGVVYILLEGAGETTTWSDVEALLRSPDEITSDSWRGVPSVTSVTSVMDAARSGARDTNTTVEFDSASLRNMTPVLPFSEKGAPPPAPRVPRPASTNAVDVDDEARTAVMDIDGMRAEQARRSVLPFIQPSSPAAPLITPPSFSPPPIPPSAPGPAVFHGAPPVPPPSFGPPPVATPPAPPAAPPPWEPRGFGAPKVPVPFAQPPSTTAPNSPAKPADLDPTFLSAAGYAGLLSASNAAARGEGPGLASQARQGAEGDGAEAPARAAGKPIELIWYDPACVTRMKKHPAWGPMFKPPPKAPAPERGKPPAPPPSQEAIEEAQKAEVFNVLSRAEPSPEGAYARAGDADAEGTPLHLLSGTLSFPLDDIQTLKLTAATAAPLAASDKKLRELLELVENVLEMPLEGVPEVTTGFVQRVRDAWSSANRLMPPDYLVMHTERLLLNQRHYQKRDLLDDTWIRALFSPEASSSQIPAYVPAKLSKRLPLFRHFSARLLVEVLPQQDMYETHPVALRVAAVARLLDAPPPAKPKA